MKKTIVCGIFALMTAAMASTALAQPVNYNSTVAMPERGLTIHFLGADNGMVRITGDGKYVLLPVEESAPDAYIRVDVNSKLEHEFNCRLAQTKVDYYVPFDLTPYRKLGKVLLDMRHPHEGRNSRPAREAMWAKHIKLSNTFDTKNTEKFRPLLHFTPIYGWMNDPNGMVYKDGEYHLSFQYGPYGSTWNNMTWGHAVSRDMITWEQLDHIIIPNGLGAIFSGSSVVDKNNTAGFGRDAIIAIFTSAGHKQIQSLAYSNDNGRTYKIYDGNPIISSDKECRDPNMFWNEKTGRWNLVLASPLEHEDIFYSSTNLKDWTFESSFGKGYGCQEGIWECPDLMQLPVRGTNENKWVLVCNINPGFIYGGSGTQYFIGEFDGHKFTCDDAPGVTKWMDWGKDHYATVSWANAPQDRHLAIAWMSNWQYADRVPTMQFRSANSIPRELDLFRDDDGKLQMGVNPVKEFDSYRGTAIKYGSFAFNNKAVSKALPKENDGVCDIVLDLNAGSATQVDITLSNSLGEKVVMTYDIEARKFSMDRRKSGITDFSAEFPGVTAAPAPKGKQQSLRLIIDRSSIEAFDGQGRFAMTNLVFPNEPYNTITVAASKGKGKVTNLTVYPLKPGH